MCNTQYPTAVLSPFDRLMAGKRRADQGLNDDAHRVGLKSARPSHSDSDLSTNGEGVPLHTSLWTRAVIDKLGVTRYKRSPERIVKEWSLSVLPEDCLKEISAMLPKAVTCFRNVDFDSIEQIKEAERCDGLPTDLMKLVQFDTGFRYPESQSASIFGTRAEDFIFTLAYIIEGLREDEDMVEWQYQILFDKFLQVFGMKTIQQPFYKMQRSKILGKEVISEADILCMTSDPRKGRSILAVCKVNKTETMKSLSPPKRMHRSSSDESSSVPAVIPDSLLAQHLGELLVYMDRSVSPRAILGMTLEQTNVRFTLLHADESVMEKIQMSDGSISFDTEEDVRPVLYYSEPLNYLKRRDRVELIKTLLQIRMMQKRFEQ